MVLNDKTYTNARGRNQMLEVENKMKRGGRNRKKLILLRC